MHNVICRNAKRLFNAGTEKIVHFKRLRIHTDFEEIKLSGTKNEDLFPNVQETLRFFSHRHNMKNKE